MTDEELLKQKITRDLECKLELLLQSKKIDPVLLIPTLSFATLVFTEKELEFILRAVRYFTV